MGPGCLRVRLIYSSANSIVSGPWWFRVLFISYLYIPTSR